MISGSMVALVTPMMSDGAIDYPALERLVEWHVQEGTDAIVVVGTTGEASTLSADENCAVIKAVLAKVAGRISVIAGTGSNCTRRTIEFTKQVQALGVDACLIVTPYYNKPSQAGLYKHFAAIAQACPGDIILYNVPGRTSVDLSNDTALKLAEFSNIVGIKDATGDLARGELLIKEAPEGFAVYSGDDETALELIGLGAKGNISVTANVAPAKVAEVCKYALSGETQKAVEINRTLSELNSLLFIEANPIPVKYALYVMGRCQDGLRLPLCTLNEKYHHQIKNALVQAGI